MKLLRKLIMNNVGLLSNIKPLIEEMLNKGIWIKKDIIEGILKEAKEK